MGAKEVAKHGESNVIMRYKWLRRWVSGLPGYAIACLVGLAEPHLALLVGEHIGKDVGDWAVLA